jgi:carbon-monoxide dehydrogenase medium subunit
MGLIRPGHVVALRRLSELRDLSLDGAGDLHIGALVTHRRVERSELVRQHHPTIAETFARIGSVRIRNQGTVGGNLGHADPAHDPPPTLIAFDARVSVARADGSHREVPIDEFFLGWFTSVLDPTEIVVGVRIPAARPDTRGAFVKFLPRSAGDYATVSAAAAVGLDGEGAISSVRIALGSVGSTSIRARGVEAALVGQPATEEVIGEAAALVRDEVDPVADGRGSAAYKREMSRVITTRALLRATGRNDHAGLVERIQTGGALR